MELGKKLIINAKIDNWLKNNFDALYENEELKQMLGLGALSTKENK